MIISCLALGTYVHLYGLWIFVFMKLAVIPYAFILCKKIFDLKEIY